MSNRPRPDRKSLRQREAAERDAKWDQLSPENKLLSLDNRGLTAKKERIKLMKLISERVK